jgi:hypothetical protein
MTMLGVLGLLQVGPFELLSVFSLRLSKLFLTLSEASFVLLVQYIAADQPNGRLLHGIRSKLLKSQVFDHLMSSRQLT